MREEIARAIAMREAAKAEVARLKADIGADREALAEMAAASLAGRDVALRMRSLMSGAAHAADEFAQATE